MTKKALADAVQVSVRSVQSWESGQSVPLDDHVQALERILRFPASFFFQSEVELLSSEIASFRSMKSMTASDRDRALSAGVLCVEICKWIDREFELPKSDLPDFRDSSPEAAAAELREIWGLGIRPIKNMIYLLELHGIRVFSLAQDAVEVDAFSFRRNDLPFVILNMQKSGERSRFDAAHELGHLVLHRHGAPNGRLAEQEADLFASAFLMPRDSVIANAPRLPTRENLVALKQIWKVSVRALITRLYSLDLVSEWHYRSFFVENADTRRTEPNPIKRERSQILGRIFGSLASDGIAKVDVAQALHIQPVDLEAFIFGLTAVSDADPSSPRRSPKKRTAPNLKLV